MESICSQYGRQLFQVAYGITRDYHHAEDVVQDALVKAYMKIDTLQNPEKIGSWLCAITARTALDYIRKEKRKNEICMENAILEYSNKHVRAEQNVEAEVELSFLQAEIDHCINQLNTDQQNAIRLRIDEGLKEKEIAAALQLKPGTVKTNIYRARKQLKLHLAGQNLV